MPFLFLILFRHTPKAGGESTPARPIGQTEKELPRETLYLPAGKGERVFREQADGAGMRRWWRWFSLARWGRLGHKRLVASMGNGGMKRLCALWVGVVLLGGIAVAESADLSRPRVWTAASGQQLAAVFVELSGDQVVLRNRSGESIRIPRNRLSAADQALLDESFGPMESVASSESSDLSRPRVWTSASGQQLMAAFVELSGNQVILKNRSGEPIRIPRTALSAGDQALLDESLGPMVSAPAAEDEFATPAPDMGAASYGTSAPSQGPITVAGTEIPLGQKTTFHVPLDEESIKALKKSKNEATEAVVGLWLPQDFDPRKEWRILLVSATVNASSIDHMHFYLDPARDAGGWIVIAGDGPHAPPSGDSTEWRWSMAKAGLMALDAAFPGARQWPIATGGFSGGAKRSGLLGGIFCRDKWNLIGMYMGGCNQDMASKGLATYRPGRAEFRKVPVFLSIGEQDTVATVQSGHKVRISLEATGFRDVRMETYDGAHDPYLPHTTEALKWFVELAAKSSASGAGAPAGRLR